MTKKDPHLREVAGRAIKVWQETFQKAGDMYEYPASHYYNRVWNYQNISISGRKRYGKG